MLTITFANGTTLPMAAMALSQRDNSEGEQRDSVVLSIAAKEISFADLITLLSSPDNLETILLTNDAVPGVDAEGNPVDTARSEAYHGYVDALNVNYRRHALQTALLDVPAVFEWIYEITLAEQTNGQKRAAAVEGLLADIPDQAAAAHADAFPLWSPMGQWDGFKYTGHFAKGCRVRHNGLLYKCGQAHDIDPRQTDWNPADAPSLWARISDPADEWPQWVQPDSTNPYAQGDKVTHNGRRYISTFGGANVWEPGTVGGDIWEETV